MARALWLTVRSHLRLHAKTLLFYTESDRTCRTSDCLRNHSHFILAVHASVYDEGDAEPFTLETSRTENAMTVEQVSCLSARKQRRELSGDQFMQVEDRDSLGLGVSEWMRIRVLDPPSRSSVHEIEIQFETGRLPSETLMAQPPLASGVCDWHHPHGEPLPGKDHLCRLLDSRTVRQHLLTLECANVVEVNLNRKPRIAQD